MFPSLALATAPMPLTIISATRRSQVTQLNAKKTKPEKKRATMATSTSGFYGRTANEQTWQCIESCGACCKLAKGFAFATPDEIFDDPDDVELFRSMIGDDGWCINYDKIDHISAELSQRFSRLSTGSKKRNSTRKLADDTIKTIHGSDSKELDKFLSENIIFESLLFTSQRNLDDGSYFNGSSVPVPAPSYGKTSQKIDNGFKPRELLNKIFSLEHENKSVCYCWNENT
ncbi:hypothetical protein HID58_048220 [Brassica napus]|uniref:Uncharacterized protein n=1 Tax=Brassica napus TaxID=3708 RepID=A0ABQ8B1G8_BRANA|nr:hypothetical protein HID58_048220 [Brassica napus]